MTIDRLATADSVAAVLLRLLTPNPILPLDRAMAALREEGLRFTETGDEFNARLAYAIDFGGRTHVVMVLDNAFVLPDRLTQSKVFTHRITADEVNGEIIALFPDCAALLPTLAQVARTNADPNESAQEAEPDGFLDDDLDDETPTGPVTLLVNDSEPILTEPLGLRDVDHSCAMPILPEGTYASAGLAAGDLVEFRLIDGVLHLDAAPAAGGVESTRPGKSAATDDAAATDAAVAHLRAVRAKTAIIESVTEFVLRCIMADRTLFDAPTAPIGELLAAAGIEREGEMIGA